MSWIDAFATVAGLACAQDSVPQVEPGEPMNVLVITLDTTRRDCMGFLGRTPSPTPSLDALAARSVVFTDAVTPVPLTLPAHASLFTGLYPFSHGVHDNSLYRVPAEASTLAEILEDEGWKTGAAVAAFVLDPVFGLDQGFSSYSAPPRGIATRATVTLEELPAAERVDRALADLRGLHEQEDSPPFFYWLHLFDPHSPYAPPNAAAVASGLALQPDVLQRALYEAEIAAMDAELGRLFGELDRLGLREKLVVVVAADHGEGLGEGREATHGHFLFDPTVRIPLLLCDPRLEPARIDLPVSLVDVMPTLLARLGVDAPRSDGLDLTPWILDPERPPPERVLALESWYVWLQFGWAPFEGCTSGTLKYVRSHGEELYQRVLDPGEKRNLFAADDPRAQGLRRRLAALQSTAAALAREHPALSEADTAALGKLGYVTGGSNAELPEVDWSTLPDAYAKLDSIRGFDEVSTAVERKELERAIALLRDLVGKEPESALFHEQLGLMLVNVGMQHADEAEQELKRTLVLDPRRARVWFALARIALARRDTARAEARKLREQGDAKGARTPAKAEREQAALAQQAIRECLRLEPTYPEGLIELGRLLFDEAERARNQDDVAQARACYDEIETVAARLLAAVPKDSAEAKDAESALRLARAKRSALPPR